jgi:hypothetical protein
LCCYNKIHKAEYFIKEWFILAHSFVGSIICSNPGEGLMSSSHMAGAGVGACMRAQRAEREGHRVDSFFYNNALSWKLS